MSNELTLDEAIVAARRELPELMLRDDFVGTYTGIYTVLAALLKAVEQMRPVVETAEKWRDGWATGKFQSDSIVVDAIDTYRTGREGRE